MTINGSNFASPLLSSTTPSSSSTTTTTTSSSPTFFSQGNSNFGSISYEQVEEWKIRDALANRLHPNSISQRPAQGMAGNVMYLEGWKAIEIANSIFGFNGWSSQIIQQGLDFMENSNDRWSVGIHCTVRVTLKDGSFRQDNGYGLSENMRSKGQAFEKARKEASTDALKRTLRLFGHALGNCLGDKEFTRKLQRDSGKNNHNYASYSGYPKPDPYSSSRVPAHRPVPDTSYAHRAAAPSPAASPSTATAMAPPVSQPGQQPPGTKFGYVSNTTKPHPAFPKHAAIHENEEFHPMDFS